GVGGILRNRARALYRLVEEVLEVRATALERRRIDVGEVVRDHLGADLLRHHASGGGAECWIHDLSWGRWFGTDEYGACRRQIGRARSLAMVPRISSSVVMVFCAAA